MPYCLPKSPYFYLFICLFCVEIEIFESREMLLYREIDVDKRQAGRATERLPELRSAT